MNVFNDSDVDGVVSFEARDVTFSGMNSRRQGREREKVVTRNFWLRQAPACRLPWY